MRGRNKSLLKPWKQRVTIIFPKAALSVIGIKEKKFIMILALAVCFDFTLKVQLEEWGFCLYGEYGENYKFLKVNAYFALTNRMITL